MLPRSLFPLIADGSTLSPPRVLYGALRAMVEAYDEPAIYLYRGQVDPGLAPPAVTSGC